MTSEVHLFSGRANPAWSTTGAETRSFRSVLDALPATAGCPGPPRDGLGFRGFGVDGLTLPGEATQHVGVDADCVRVEAADGSRSHLLDERRAAYRFLVDLVAGRDPSLQPLLTAG